MEGLTPLTQSVLFDKMEIVQILLSNGTAIDLPDRQGATALIHAVCSGHVEPAQQLLEHGADVDKCDLDGMTALHYAEKKGDPAIVALITDYMQSCQLELFHATKRGDVKQIRAALEKVNNVEIRDDRGKTPLLLAAAEGQLEAVKFLLDAKVRVNAAREDGRTALMVATEQREREDGAKVAEMWS